MTVSHVAGQLVAELSLVPKLFVTRTMAALHKTQTPRWRNAWLRWRKRADSSLTAKWMGCPLPTTNTK
jgi:hypothetical protein